MAYAKALQCWAKRAKLPMLGQPCLLAGSILELQMMMEQYILFSDDIILGGVTLPEGFFGSQTSVSTDAPPTISGALKESMLPQVPHEKWVKMEAPQN